MILIIYIRKLNNKKLRFEYQEIKSIYIYKIK